MPGRSSWPPPSAMLHEPLCQRAMLVARRRMDHHAGRLVDDQQPVVLVDHLVGHVLRRERGGRLGAALPRDDFAEAQLMSLAGRPVVDGHAPFFDEALGGRARETGARRQRYVEAHTDLVRQHREASFALRLSRHAGPARPG